MLNKYIDKDVNAFELQVYIYEIGDHACVGCAFKFGNSNACKEAPTCTPNTNAQNRSEPIPYPNWVGKNLVWKLIE